jgi:hypothetical protein
LKFQKKFKIDAPYCPGPFLSPSLGQQVRHGGDHIRHHRLGKSYYLKIQNLCLEKSNINSAALAGTEKI